LEICIVGTGYVGLVTAACLAETGNNVYCVDIDPAVIGHLNDGKIHIFEPGLEVLVQRNVEAKRLQFTTELEDGLRNALFVFICVGTPSVPDGSCDLSYVRQVASQIGKLLDDFKIVINKSTVPIGTADEVREIIDNELIVRDVEIQFDVVSNPEFLKEGSAVNDFMRPDRIIIGVDNVRTTKLMETLYAPFARARDKLVVMDVRSAEMTKYAANCMLATKISLMNEFANICEKIGANIMEVRTGIGADRRIGYQFIYPGIGYGGSCFPKDVRALIKAAQASGANTQLIAAVDAVNNRQKKILSEKIIEYFADKGGVEGKTLSLWGLAFKSNTDDVRESAALDIIQTLVEKGMKIKAFDPAANENARKIIGDLPLVRFFADQYRVLEGADALAVATDWNQFKNPDFFRIKKELNAPILFDGRNLYSPSFLKSQGFEYISIGRPDVTNYKPS
jgi:UDPglucose 6-dehydrogenase